MRPRPNSSHGFVRKCFRRSRNERIQRFGHGQRSHIDYASYLTSRLVYVFAVVLTLSFLLLMVVFRSIFVPIKAVIMNMLSIGAAMWW
ncbi:MAG: hypothetical protein R2843_11425 [Thermomicrobiales bacterium]